MKGLLKKDWLVLKATWIQLALIFTVITGLLVFFDLSVGIVSFVTIYFAMQGVTTVINDKMSGWNAYQITFPLSRANEIREKYLFSFILAAAGFALGALISFAIDPNMAWEQFAISSMIGWILTLSAISVGIPLLAMRPRSAFSLGIFGAFIPGSVCVAAWQMILSESMKTINPLTASAAEMLRLDILYWCLAAMAVFTILSVWLAPGIMSRRDQK